MRKSLREIQQIEAYCIGRLNSIERQAFEMEMLVQPDLKEKVQIQQKIYQIIKWMERRLLRREIRSIEAKLFQQPSYQAFQKEVEQIFS